MFIFLRNKCDISNENISEDTKVQLYNTILNTEVRNVKRFCILLYLPYMIKVPLRKFRYLLIRHTISSLA